MALDRSSIEKKDFPTARQGYDKAAVDAHLAAIAGEFEHLTLASSASERVRAIVEAAETSAAQIQREADDAAQATRQEAEQAARHAREGAGRVSELAAALTEQLDAGRRQLEALVGSLPGVARGAGTQPQARTEALVDPDPADTEVRAPAPEPAPVAASAPAPAPAPEVPAPPASEHRAGRGDARRRPGRHRRRERRRAPDRAQHGAQRFIARRDREVPRRELPALRSRPPARRGLRERRGLRPCVTDDGGCGSWRAARCACDLGRARPRRGRAPGRIAPTRCARR